MKYFFILGNNPTLSLAELSAVFDLKNNEEYILSFSKNALILDLDEDINPKELIKKLGGTIKIGMIEAQEFKLSNLPGQIQKAIINSYNNQESKFHFGISQYGKIKLNFNRIGIEIKRTLKEQSINSRFVISKEQALSSVIVEQNKLLSSGVEIVLIKPEQAVYIGKTLAVQPFKDLSFRDFQRPGRDDYSGMLPPKLAQIMINLTETDNDKHVLDPFCGSGTVISEAMLMGYTNISGTDISSKAISDTIKNIHWINKKFPQEQKLNENTQLDKSIFLADVCEISKYFENEAINAIITEPYLGPQRGNRDFTKIKKDLDILYSKALAEFEKILNKSGKIVMIWPVFKSHNNIYLEPNIQKFKSCQLIPNSLKSHPEIQLSSRKTIIYGREGQSVWREIIVLEKIIKNL